jgi:hypothetical protein
MPGEDPKRGRAPTRRYSALVGLAFLILLTIATINTLRTPGGGILGISAGDEGMPLAEFAVPNALTGPLDKDANIAQDDCSTSENPCPSGSMRPSACQIHVPGAIRVCDLFNRPLVLSFWFTRGANCLPTQDILNRLAARYLSIDVRDDPADVRKIALDHHWTMPVGYDRDGAVSDLYRVGGCPTVAFAYPGGILAFAKAKLSELSERQTAADVRRLLRLSAVRERESR